MNNIETSFTSLSAIMISTNLVVLKVVDSEHPAFQDVFAWTLIVAMLLLSFAYDMSKPKKVPLNAWRISFAVGISLVLSFLSTMLYANNRIEQLTHYGIISVVCFLGHRVIYKFGDVFVDKIGEQVNKVIDGAGDGAKAMVTTFVEKQADTKTEKDSEIDNNLIETKDENTQ